MSTNTFNLYKSKWILYTLLLFTSFLSAQRFLISPLDAYFCLIPFVISLIYFKNILFRNTLLLFALFISVDNAAIGLADTFAPIRIAIYLTSIYTLYESNLFNVKYIAVFGVMLTIYLMLTFFNLDNIDFGTLYRDILLLSLVFPVFCSSSTKSKFPIDFELLNCIILVYIISEVVNILIRPLLGFDTSDYLNYISTKSFIVFPSIYYLINKKFKLALPIVFITLIVLIAYTTRMIILTYTLILILILFKSVRIRMKNILVILVLLVCSFLIYNITNFEFNGSKATTVFIQLFTEGDLFEKFLIIDPVRYNETKLFFNRSLFSVLFGDGLGSGLIDSRNDLGFVKFTDTAFTIKELQEGKYYNLHDTWIDLGLRFGFLSIVLLYLQIFRWLYFKNIKTIQIVGAILVVLFSCATYSTQGLILLAYLFYNVKVEESQILIKN